MARLRILEQQGFYGLLLMHMIFSLDESCETASTDGVRIYFGPKFLDEISDKELEFVMIHEIMHVVLHHCFRQGDRDNEAFNIACDIVVNSNIMLSKSNSVEAITLQKYGESMHLAPNGKEGHLYTAEEVYAMLPEAMKTNSKKGGRKTDAQGSGSSDSQESDSGNGSSSSNSQGDCNDNQSGPGGSPLGRGLSQKDVESGCQDGTGQNGSDASQLGTNQNDSQGGCGSQNGPKQKGKSVSQGAKAQSSQKTPGTWDDHTHWGFLEEDDVLREVWVKRFEDAYAAIQIRDPSNSRGLVPMFARRMMDEFVKPQTDWRTILNDFVQQEIVDYSFAPPDRRFSDSPFFLPDFNDKEDIVEDILFMVDTSGSMADNMIQVAYSEVKGALDQYDGKLKGWLGFFDAAIIEPKPFENEEELKIIKPAGGGGTDFQIIFEYVQQHMQDRLPACIIILTDGYAPIPKEHLACGIPVLWLINNEDVTPPWGKIARIKV